MRGNAFPDSVWKVKWQPFRNLLCYLGNLSIKSFIIRCMSQAGEVVKRTLSNTKSTFKLPNLIPEKKTRSLLENLLKIHHIHNGYSILSNFSVKTQQPGLLGPVPFCSISKLFYIRRPPKSSNFDYKCVINSLLSL
ncbi:hypothetical protein AVEN_263053-1 [Araneus ventricosus]|uniref:Uncharacterized protein n=1 Tax=Araneus ventricosus TaxID=182803 RepID=A0A4Y2PHQ4_ARAVE|nr:hypothetical protein AVEN_263053-1 [Araneus ventricosus]